MRDLLASQKKVADGTKLEDIEKQLTRLKGMTGSSMKCPCPTPARVSMCKPGPLSLLTASALSEGLSPHESSPYREEMECAPEGLLTS